MSMRDLPVPLVDVQEERVEVEQEDDYAGKEENNGQRGEQTT